MESHTEKFLKDLRMNSGAEQYIKDLIEKDPVFAAFVQEQERHAAEFDRAVAESDGTVESYKKLLLAHLQEDIASTKTG